MRAEQLWSWVGNSPGMQFDERSREVRFLRSQIDGGIWLVMSALEREIPVTRPAEHVIPCQEQGEVVAFQEERDGGFCHCCLMARRVERCESRDWEVVEIRRVLLRRVQRKKNCNLGIFVSVV